MDRVKEIIIKVIPAKIANAFVEKHHYSGKVVPNSNLHFGAFLDGKLHGVLSYGPSLCKHKMLGIVEGTQWNEFLELNRMAFDDYLPRNSESYCIARTLKMIRKYAPQIKWVISFADGCQCGDGTIYRASNFVLTGITEGKSFYRLPNGESYTAITMKLHGWGGQLAKCCSRELFDQIVGTKVGNMQCIEKLMETIGATKLQGFSLRYIYFIDKSYRKRLTCPEIPFSRIDELGAGMYKGENITRAERHKSVDK
jgi:hypothetical protein